MTAAGPRVLRQAGLRALALGLVLAAVAALAGARPEAVLRALLLAGLAAVVTVSERATLPARIDTRGRRALVAWPASALWVCAVETQVAYYGAIRAGHEPDRAWREVWTHVASSGTSPLVGVAIVTSWLPAVVFARLTPSTRDAQVKLALAAAFWSTAAAAMAVEGTLGRAGSMHFYQVVVAGIMAALVAAASVTVLGLMDALQRDPPAVDPPPGAP